MKFWARWRQRDSHDKLALHSSRLVVFDLESTGLDPFHDEALAIGAVGISQGSLELDRSFHLRLQAKRLSEPAAMLAHRLTDQAMRDAEHPANALKKWLAWLNQAPCFAYHAQFDDSLMQRSLTRAGIEHVWIPSIDLADWLLWLHPELGPKPPTLDQALAFARIHTAHSQRHHALSDASLSGQLLLWLQAHSADKNLQTLGELRKALLRAGKLRQIQSQSF